MLFVNFKVRKSFLNYRVYVNKITYLSLFSLSKARAQNLKIYDYFERELALATRRLKTFCIATLTLLSQLFIAGRTNGCAG